MRKALSVLIMVTLLAAAVAAVAAGAKNAPDVQGQWWGKPPAKPVQPGEPANVAGKIAAINATSITLQLREGTRTFAITPKTKVRVHGEQATIADVKVGDPGIVRFVFVNKVATAIGIMVPEEALGGKVVSVQDNIITARTKDNKELRIAVNDATKYITHRVQGSDGYIGTLADIRPGYIIMVKGNLVDGVVQAQIVNFTPVVARGAVIAVDGNLVTLKTKRQQPIQVEVSQATVILVRPRVGPNVKGTLADIKVGMPADIGFHFVPNGPGQLLWIDLLTGM